MGRFPFNKNFGLKFQKFQVPSRAVHSGWTDPTQATARLVIVLVSRIQKSGSGQQFCQMERDISVPPTEMTRLVKVDHLQSWSRIFRSDQTEMVRSIWCTNRNFRNFGLNGKRPWTEAPSASIRFCLKTDFFLRFGLPPTRIRWKQSLKTDLSKTLPRVKIFENDGFLFTCGRTKTEVFEYYDVGRKRYLRMRNFLKTGKKSQFS